MPRRGPARDRRVSLCAERCSEVTLRGRDDSVRSGEPREIPAALVAAAVDREHAGLAHLQEPARELTHAGAAAVGHGRLAGERELRAHVDVRGAHREGVGAVVREAHAEAARRAAGGGAREREGPRGADRGEPPTPRGFEAARDVRARRRGPIVGGRRVFGRGRVFGDAGIRDLGDIRVHGRVGGAAGVDGTGATGERVAQRGAHREGRIAAQATRGGRPRGAREVRVALRAAARGDAVEGGADLLLAHRAAAAESLEVGADGRQRGSRVRGRRGARRRRRLRRRRGRRTRR